MMRCSAARKMTTTWVFRIHLLTSTRVNYKSRAPRFSPMQKAVLNACGRTSSQEGPLTSMEPIRFP
jgi:predicted metalloprotease